MNKSLQTNKSSKKGVIGESHVGASGILIRKVFILYMGWSSWGGMLPQAYLTDRQLEIWRLRLRGLSKAEIGRRLGVTRQAVYDAEGVMQRKVKSALRHAAEANMIEVRYVDSGKGILLGFSPATRNRVIVTFSAKNGVQTWHYEQPDCGACQWEERCRNRLLAEAEEREIRVSDEERQLPPSKLAHLIFSKVIPGLTL